MRIVWNDQEEYFQIEFSQGEFWAEDQDKTKAAGCKTTGPPSWTWYTSKASVLNKLRSLNPKSGITATEVSMSKYKALDEAEKKKKELRKQFKGAKKAAKKTEVIPEQETYLDEDTGIVCILVPTAKSVYRNTFIRPEPPVEKCLICDEPIYFYEHLVCLFCENEISP